MKCYNLTKNPDRTAELTMYGEVVQTRPVDWWTGEPVNGDFICQDEILRELDNLGDVTCLIIHLNSVGGDYYAGLAIRNRIRSLGIRVETINDSLAASAGSIIMQAASGGGKRKCYASSNLMVHGVSGFMYGYYNMGDLTKSIKNLEAADKAAAICYAESGTVSEEDAKAAMDAEIWLTGQEAVERGFADEVISLAEPKETTLTDDFQMQAGGIRMYAGWLRNYATLPKNIVKVPALPDNHALASPHDNHKEEKNMEIKNKEELKTAFPEFTAQLEAAAAEKVAADMQAQINNAVAAERERIKSIDEIAVSVQDSVLIREAKYDKPMTAEQLALAAMKKQAALGAAMLGNMAADTVQSGVAAVNGLPAEDGEDAEIKNMQQMMIGFANKK